MTVRFLRPTVIAYEVALILGRKLEPKCVLTGAL